MQTKLGIKVNDYVTFVDPKSNIHYKYTVEGIEVKTRGNSKTTIRMEVTRGRHVLSSNSITLPSHMTTVVGKLKLAMRHVKEDFAVVHFMHPRWCCVDPELCSFEFSELDVVDAPTRGEPGYTERTSSTPTNKGYVNHRTSRSEKIRHDPKQKGVPEKSESRDCSAPPIFGYAYGDDNKNTVQPTTNDTVDETFTDLNGDTETISTHKLGGDFHHKRKDKSSAFVAAYGNEGSNHKELNPKGSVVSSGHLNPEQLAEEAKELARNDIRVEQERGITILSSGAMVKLEEICDNPGEPTQDMKDLMS